MSLRIMDYQAEQEMEVEALESILMDDFQGAAAACALVHGLPINDIHWVNRLFVVVCSSFRYLRACHDCASCCRSARRITQWLAR